MVSRFFSFFPKPLLYKKPVCNLLYASKVAGVVGLIVGGVEEQEAEQGRIGSAVWCPVFTEASFMEIGMMREQKEGDFRIWPRWTPDLCCPSLAVAYLLC